MNIAIVVLNWNDWKNSIDCLESIYQNKGKFDVFLVDNGSAITNFLKIIQWHRGLILPNRKYIKTKEKKLGRIIYVNPKKNIFNEIKNLRNLYVIKNKINYGLTKGLNIAYNYLIRNNYDIILRIDNDFVISKDYIEKILITVKNKDVSSASPKIMHASIKKNVWFKGFKMNWFYLKFQKTMNLKKRRLFDNNKLNNTIETDVISGCCSVYKSQILKKSGLGDEDFFYGPEDIELSYRLKKHGKLICNRKIKTFHKIARSSAIADQLDRTFQSTYGFLTLIKKIGTTSDKIFGYSFFLLRGVYYFFFLKNNKIKKGYIKALSSFFKDK